METDTGSLLELADKLRDGVTVKDRKWLLKTYKACFIGTDAVSWLVNNDYADDRESAVLLGNQLLGNHFFHHVMKDHDFQDSKLYYRFAQDEEGDEPEKKSWVAYLPLLASSEEGDVGLQAHLPEKEDLSGEARELHVRPLDEWNLKLLDHVHPPEWEDPDASGTFNLVVIGAGSGGLVSAAGAAGLGAKVALIEDHLMGGDCLNVGCVPSKALISAARAVHNVKRAAEFGVILDGPIKVDFPAVMERLRRLRSEIAPNDSVHRFSDLGVKVFMGRGKFTSRSTVEVNGHSLKFAKAIIATGGRASIPPIEGLRDANPLTNSTVFNLTELPARIGVIGAGAIGCELAQSFQRFGTEVHLFFRSAHILAREDPEAAAIVQESLARDGVRMHSHSRYERIRVEDGCKIIVTSDGEVPVDEIIVAAGRSPNIDGLGLDHAGVKFDTRSGVQVSDTLQTTNGNVYAVGDVATRYQFTHMSDAMARIAIRNALFFGRAKASALIIPWCTYTEPEIAHVGLYESDLKERGIKFSTFIKEFDDNDRAILEGEARGFVKILTKEGSDTILGATIVGAHAGDMISEVTTAMVGKVGLGTMATVIHPYPTQAASIGQCGDEYNRTRLTPSVKILFRKLLAARRTTKV